MTAYPAASSVQFEHPLLKCAITYQVSRLKHRRISNCNALKIPKVVDTIATKSPRTIHCYLLPHQYCQMQYHTQQIFPVIPERQPNTMSSYQEGNSLLLTVRIHMITHHLYSEHPQQDLKHLLRGISHHSDIHLDFERSRSSSLDTTFILSSLAPDLKFK